MGGAGLGCCSRAGRFLVRIIHLLLDLLPIFEHVQLFSHLPRDSLWFFFPSPNFTQKRRPKSPVEVKALGGKRGDDIRLSCCTRASGDVVIKTKP
jgi:hypothetical protein